MWGKRSAHEELREEITHWFRTHAYGERYVHIDLVYQVWKKECKKYGLPLSPKREFKSNLLQCGFSVRKSRVMQPEVVGMAPYGDETLRGLSHDELTGRVRTVGMGRKKMMTCMACGESRDTLYGYYPPSHGAGFHEAIICDYCSSSRRWADDRARWEWDRGEVDRERHEREQSNITPLPGENSMREYMKLHHDAEDNYSIESTIRDEADFTRRFSAAMAALAAKEPDEDVIQAQLAGFLPLFSECVLKMRGYKAPLVEEHRLLIAGRLSPNEATVVAFSEGNNGNRSAVPEMEMAGA